MKQRITLEQLNELIDAQKEQLRQWWNLRREPGDIYINSTGYIDLINKYGYKPDGVAFPLLSIGQMIDFIETKEYPTLHIEKQLKKGMMESDSYKVFQQGRGTSHGDTLCDALWEAVKNVLKNQQ